MLHDIVEVRHIKDFTVFLVFDNGVQGEVDLSQFVTFEGVFAALSDISKFAEVFVEKDIGTICWPNGADIAPETLYQCLVEQRTSRSA